MGEFIKEFPELDVLPRTMLVVLALLCADCAAQKSPWEDLDYSGVYRKYSSRENDPGYSPPANVTGCVDDDLYNCK